jgi:putative FmdB family regulatory protein
MPVYEYRCKSCGKTHEIEHGVNAERPTVCPSCGGALARVFHPIGVVFKGSGFYKTDYGASSKQKPAPESSSSESKSSESKTAESKSDAASKSGEKKTDSKPAPKPDKSPESKP